MQLGGLDKHGSVVRRVPLVARHSPAAVLMCATVDLAALACQRCCTFPLQRDTVTAPPSEAYGIKITPAMKITTEQTSTVQHEQAPPPPKRNKTKRNETKQNETKFTVVKEVVE